MAPVPVAPPSGGSRPRVGVIGLGIMGGEYARHLVHAGFDVVGRDTDPARQDALRAAGGRPCDTAREVLAGSDAVVIALSSIAVFEALLLGDDSIADVARPGQLFIETGTLPIALKEAARERLARRGAELIDAPVTGTRLHAQRRELVVYASGPEAVVARARPVLEAFARDVRFVGPFGAGMKLKLVTNHLVAIHNVATAEALALADRAGLDLHLVHDLVAGGPASSAVFGFRGPLMIAQRYRPATMRQDVFAKDLHLIEAFAASVDAAAPLFEASLGVYRASLGRGMDDADVAATFELLRRGAHPDATDDGAPVTPPGTGRPPS